MEVVEVVGEGLVVVRMEVVLVVEVLVGVGWR